MEGMNEEVVTKRSGEANVNDENEVLAVASPSSPEEEVSDDEESSDEDDDDAWAPDEDEVDPWAPKKMKQRCKSGAENKKPNARASASVNAPKRILRSADIESGEDGRSEKRPKASEQVGKTQQPNDDTATGWTPSTVNKVMKREALKDATPGQMKRLEKVIGKVFEEGSDLAWARKYFREDGTFGKANRGGKCSLLVPTSEVGKFKSLLAKGRVGTGIYDSEGKSFARSSGMIGKSINRAYVDGQKEVSDPRGQIYDSAASPDDNKATFLNEDSKVMDVVSKCEPDLFEKHNGKGVIISPSMHDHEKCFYDTIGHMVSFLRNYSSADFVVLSNKNRRVERGRGIPYLRHDKIVMLHKCFYRGNRDAVNKIGKMHPFPGED